jgi:hypothetical protein
MKQLLPFSLLLLLFAFLFPACGKDKNEDGFYIEATINGRSWKGTGTSRLIAINSADNSQMQIATNTLPVGSYNFFTNIARGVSFSQPSVVQLTNIQVGAYDSRLTIKWLSQFETNVARYEIQRAQGNANTFFVMGSVPAQGTSTTQVDYQLPIIGTETFLNQQTEYYRIRIIKTDSSFIYSGVMAQGGLDGTHPMISYLKNGKMYYCLDNNMNNVTITARDNTPDGWRKGTFSFDYKDENGNVVQVRNGKFRLRY